MIETATKISRILMPLITGTLLLFPVFFAPVAAESNTSEDDPSSARIYRTPEERREAGLGRQLTEWLKVSGLIEVEREDETFRLLNDSPIRDSGGTVYNGQLAMELSLGERVSAEITVEVEKGSGTHTILDEALIIVELDPLEIELGRLSLPFGEYYSHFTVGPVVEVSETLAEGFVAAYELTDRFEVSAFTFISEVESFGASRSIDWGFNMEFVNEFENIKLGAGYLSDLAEGDEQLLDDFNNRYQQRVGAWNAYALFGFDQFEITSEYFSADSRFTEFDAEFDKPRAWNFELAVYLSRVSQLSFRFEQSREIEEAPESQYGINLTWRPSKYALLSLEYLKGEFKEGTLVDDDDRSIVNRETIAAQLAIEF